MTAQPAEPDELDFLSFVEYAIAETTRELPDVDPVAMRLVLTLHRLTSALVYDLESAVHRPSGWSWPGFRLLFVLWLAGPLEAKRAAQLSGMSRAAVSALVNTLERDGLVSRTPAPHDRRAVRLALTETGRRRITEAYTAHNARERTWAATLSKPERTILIGLLEKLMTGPAATEAKQRF
ncbi:DNA-binding transcriptional regulator, MarR family [Amycolatopsis arida]|uniref:DNA-binding transcriptional regulator, MarR family n=1 Tax=Amycolatopsis arida TaxID=587909 RepID=A0A1I5KQY3_9PSEU|nr:MarR family transcriptional regulator [Amycolatopsis arida]TDX97147.1 DNA-binding MarR family transcriptional regulator [Amycolatopsis arida]SFO87056.1 DNA-binding transcriptional regulator, MarR family [Amycolatopsis arida]